MLRIYCDTGAGGHKLLSKIKKLIKNVEFYGVPSENANKHLKNGKPSAKSLDEMGGSLDDYTSCSLDEIYISPKYPDLLELIDKQNIRDVQHLDSAYRTGCSIFLTSDCRDIYKKREKINSIIDIKIFNPHKKLEELMNYLDVYSHQNEHRFRFYLQMKRKRIKQVPDEAFEKGAIRFERYGKNILFKNRMSQDQFFQLQKNLIDEYPKVIDEINKSVTAIASLVSKLPPDKLLYRAFWGMATQHIGVEAESDIEDEHSLSMRMIDYIQSVIASVPPGQDQLPEVSDTDWETLVNHVNNLFNTLNINYHLCNTAKRKADNIATNDDMEELVYKAQMYWCNVRGFRYQVHDLIYLEEVFLPLTVIIEKVFGITSRQFVDEIAKIHHSLSFGPQEVLTSWGEFQSDVGKAIDSVEIEGDISLNEPDKILEKILKDNNWEERNEKLIGGLLMDIFDIQKITSLSVKLLDELSWSQGQETDFFAPGDYSGWPLRIWAIFKRPFLKINNRYYCFHLHSLLDHLYRVMFRAISRIDPSLKTEWNSIQKTNLEELALGYFKKILPDSVSLSQIYYKWFPNDSVKSKEWCEADGIVLFDRNLLIIECKAGAFTYTSPANDFPAYIKSLENLVLNPLVQGKRFYDYLNSAEEVDIFDDKHNKIYTLRKEDLDSITICTVTLDSFTEISAQIQHLHNVGIDVGKHPIWSISLDDLRVYANIFSNPLFFIHYMKQRIKAFNLEHTFLFDELDHVGLYLEYNHYGSYADEMRKQIPLSSVTFNSYKTPVDKFFHQRMYDPAKPCPLQQTIPLQLLDVINFLSQADKPGRSNLVSFLLDFSGEWRNKISQSILNEIGMHSVNKRTRPISLRGGQGLNIYCYTEKVVPRWISSRVLLHSYASLLVSEDENSLQLELIYNDDQTLQNVDWLWIKRTDIKDSDVEKISKYADDLRIQRINAAILNNGKISRNAPCPCGKRNIKYKNCCLNRKR